MGGCSRPDLAKQPINSCRYPYTGRLHEATTPRRRAIRNGASGLECRLHQVHVVQCRLDNGLYAMKAIAKHKASRFSQVSRQLAKLMQSIQLSAERHLHILADGAHAPKLFAAFQTSSMLYLVMDLATSGSLADRIESYPAGLELPEVAQWTAQLVDAISWVHDRGFVHRCVRQLPY